MKDDEQSVAAVIVEDCDDWCGTSGRSTSNLTICLLTNVAVIGIGRSVSRYVHVTL